MFMKLWLVIKGLLSRKPADELDRLDVFAPGERLIYKFFDGSKQRAVDPLPLYKRLKDVWPELSADIKGARMEQSKFCDAAYDGMVQKCYRVFEVQPFNQLDGGLSEIEVLNLLDHFLAYTGGVKKNLNRPPTSAEATPASTASSPAEESPTPSTSDSGSTEGVPSTGSASPSLRGPESPSAS